MPFELWIQTLAACAAAPSAPPSPLAAAEVWLDVSPALLVAAAAGEASASWQGQEIAALDSAGRMHLVVRIEAGPRALTCDLPVSRPARLLVGDVDGRLAGGEVYALGAAGDLWQALPLTASGELRVQRIAGEFPRNARALALGEFRTGVFVRELLVLDECGAFELFRIDPHGELQRRPVDVTLPPATSLLLVDRELERLLILGIGRPDGLLLVADTGGLWGFTELLPDTERSRFAEGAGRLLGFGRASPSEGPASHLFDQTSNGDLRALTWRAGTSHWETVIERAPHIAGAMSARRRAPDGGERLWTLDVHGAVRLSTRGPGVDDLWTTEIAHDVEAPGVVLFLYDAQNKIQDSTARLIAARGSRIVDLGAP